MHGQRGWVAALTPLSVDGTIIAASTTLLADSRCGRRGGFLPWALLVMGSAASLAANVAVAGPTATGRVIAAWRAFSLIAGYELLMRQVRRVAEAAASGQGPRRSVRAAPAGMAAAAGKMAPGQRCGCRLAGMCAWLRGSGSAENVAGWRASVGPGYREPVRPSRAVGADGHAVRSSRRTGGEPRTNGSASSRTSPWPKPDGSGCGLSPG